MELIDESISLLNEQMKNHLRFFFALAEGKKKH